MYLGECATAVEGGVVECRHMGNQCICRLVVELETVDEHFGTQFFNNGIGSESHGLHLVVLEETVVANVVHVDVVAEVETAQTVVFIVRHGCFLLV